MSCVETRRAVGRWIGVALVAGFVYSAMSTVNEYRRIAERPAATGSNATVGGLLTAASLPSADELRRALSLDQSSMGEIAFVAPASVPDHDVQQTFFAVSYLLAPHPVPLVRWCDREETACARNSIADPIAEAERRGLRSAIVLGRNPFGERKATHISGTLLLVHW